MLTRRLKPAAVIVVGETRIRIDEIQRDGRWVEVTVESREHVRIETRDTEPVKTK